MAKNNPSDTKSLILDLAIPLFANKGYSGTSMRTIAKEAGISAAALYHHYPDKQTLYLAAMERAFVDKFQGITPAIDNSGSIEDRLFAYVSGFTNLVAADQNFRMLIQRELLDGDEIRLKLLAEQVFGEAFKSVVKLAHDIDPDSDAHMLVISMAGLVLFHFETAPVRRFLPGRKKRHDKNDVIIRHIYNLLSQLLVQKS